VVTTLTKIGKNGTQGLSRGHAIFIYLRRLFNQAKATAMNPEHWSHFQHFYPPLNITEVNLTKLMAQS
jgi:hypothetical protein